MTEASTHTPDLSTATLRIARPTPNIQALLSFYRDGLGFDVLGEFSDHDGFDGVMLGRTGAPYHLEFTYTRHPHHPHPRQTKHDDVEGEPVSDNATSLLRAPSQDNLLVFYLPDTEAWKAAVEKMQKAGHRATKSFNPYWDVNGVTFEDPDGYRVVLQNAAWNL